jgi:hypothetical protein
MLDDTYNDYVEFKRDASNPADNEDIALADAECDCYDCFLEGK